MTPGGCPATSGKTPGFNPDQMVGAARFAQNHPLRSLRPLREINPPPCGRDGVRPSPRCGISASTVAPLTLSSVFSNLLSVIRFLLLGVVSTPIMENRMAFFKPSASPMKKRVTSEEALKAFESIRAEVQSRGVPEMTMEEIDAEIAAARKERRERQAKELAMAGAR